jgi:hypothetical protein
VDPVPDPLFLRKSGSAGNQTLKNVHNIYCYSHFTCNCSIFLVLSACSIFTWSLVTASFSVDSLKPLSKSKLYYDRRSVGHYWCPALNLGPMTRSFIYLFPFHDYRLLAVGRSIWQEDGSVIYSYNCFWALPGTRDHILLSQLRLPQPGGQIPVFMSPRNRVFQLHPRTLGFLYVASYD